MSHNAKELYCIVDVYHFFPTFVQSDEFPSSSEVLDPPSSPDPLSDQATTSPQPERITSLSATENPEMQVTQSGRNESKTIKFIFICNHEN